MHSRQSARPGATDAGAQPAFELVVRRHHAAVWRLGWRIFRNDAEAEDLARQVFVSAQAAFPALSGEADVAGWLRELTVRHAVAFAEHERDGAERSDGLDLVEASFLSLDRVLRVTVALQLETESYDDTARLLGAPVQTVRSRLRRARLAVHKSLSRKQARHA